MPFKNRIKEVLIIRVRAWNKEVILPQRLDFVMNLLQKNAKIKFFDIQPERKLGYYVGYFFSFLAAYPKLLFSSCDTVILENPYLVIFAPIFKLRRKRIVAEYVDYYPANLNRLQKEKFFRYQVAKVICGIFHRFVSVITTESETGQRTLERWGVPTKKIVILPVGINTTKMHFSSEQRTTIRKQYNINPATVVFGYLGKMVNFYYLENILYAVAKLQNKFDIKTFFVGDGPYRAELEKLSSELQLTTIFTGNIPHEKVHAYYSAMDLFIFPLNSLAIKIAEILSIGGPVLLVTGGMAEDWIKDGENGLVSKQSNPNYLTPILKKFLSMSQIDKNKIISNQRKFALEHLDRRIIAKNYLKLI